MNGRHNRHRIKARINGQRLWDSLWSWRRSAPPPRAACAV